MFTRIPLLIVGEEGSYTDETLRLATHPDYDIRYAKTGPVASELFDNFHPNILILAFSDLSQAIDFYANLLLDATRSMEFPHLCILMCDGKQIEQAARYCCQNLVDEYVVLRPLYDSQRLAISLKLMNRLITSIEPQSATVERAFILLKEMGGIEQLLATHLLSQRAASSAKGSHKLNEFLIERFRQDTQILQKSKLKESFNESSEVVLSVDIEPKEKWHGRKQPLVLIVEDEEVNQKMMKMVLEREGFQVAIAIDGAAALSSIEQFNPDIVFMDIRLPKLNGLEATRRLKNQAKWSDLPIIMLSSHDEKVIVRECLKSGAVDYLIKPAKRKDLLERVYRFTNIEPDKYSEAG